MSDFAAGTSSRSSKLAHGGLRYLERMRLGLVREALRERALLLTRIAPELVQPTPFLYPLRGSGAERAYVSTGLTLYDALAGRERVLPRHRSLSRAATLARAPGLHPATTGALEYWDCTVDDARLTLGLARTAAAFGAAVASRTQVIGFRHRDDRVTGVRIVDLEGGGELEVEARCVVCAVGVWTEELERLAVGAAPLRITASKGVHLVLRRERFESDAAVITRTADSVLLVVPWDGHWLVGTTDTPWTFAPDRPATTAADIAYLLAQANKIFREPLAPADVIATFAGLRPLVAARRKPTSRLSREHAVASVRPGLTVVAGGKLTTYRVTARDAIDAAARELPRVVPPSATEHVRLVGHSRDEELAALVAADPQLGLPLAGAPGHLRAEVVHAVTHEGALHLDDVLLRRTHVALELPDGGLAAAEPVARVMSGPLQWDEGRLQDELAAVRRRIAADARARALPSDEAVAAALG